MKIEKRMVTFEESGEAGVSFNIFRTVKYWDAKMTNQC